MNQYRAKDGERLEAIFYAAYGVDSPYYADFLKKNLHLIRKDHLDAGDEVFLYEFVEESTVATLDTISFVPTAATVSSAIQERISIW